ncbi:putative secreted protein with C-terminal beta-propeller domain [Cytobacillus eiseniae]|uniref:Secreted protein with C-terminal beta-propeller domain n=1 Tax=Cytobacillus eiseniae TaxID=762947 RepID=A0ABS4RA10_9BACI|nr:beta-propeller domain-containing protein [Cytobacillus eiseniae]MBP2239727.1 putative secreted protein with C-terminal beta-propeller domain [Cytobacillus eiseniae]
MKKKWLLIGGVLMLMIIVLTGFFVNQLKVVGGIDPEEELIILKNKLWRIHFSDKLDPVSVNQNTVYVLNKKNEKEEVNISLSNDQKTILINPNEDGYNNGSYLLQLSKEIRSQKGKKLVASVTQKFSVKETLPVAESKSKLNGHLLKRMNEIWDHNKYNAVEEKTMEDSSAAVESESSQEYSETNVQVNGIDEADIVKTDGTHIFQLKDNTLQIIKATPANKMAVEKIITYDHSFYPSQLFLQNDQLIVMGTSYKGHQNDIKPAEMKIAPVHETTKAIVYNLADKKNPTVIKEIEIEGTLVTSRLMSGKVYIIANQYPDYWLLRENPEIDIRPRYSDTSDDSKMKAVKYDEIQYFPDSKETNFTNIAVIDLEKPNKKIALTSYLGSGNQLYMSKENLYLAVTNYLPIAADGNYSFNPDTTVYKFSVDGMNVEFHSSSEITGTILNQFSMDEYDGYFRIATTKGQVWDDERPSANNLYILDENLKQVGQLEDLARGERIYSARFMNERIFIVTFKETDPLFVIDGSNPKQPKVLGELKIPGFSNYLHPYDENHLIGFGHDTKVLPGKGANSQPIILTNGVKLSLFDITDLSNPKEKFTEIIGGRGTYSALNYDHKALLFDKKKNLFAFPITVYENEHSTNELEWNSNFEFQGAYVYNIDLDNGFSLKARMSHQDADAIYEEWVNNIQRVMYIGDNLYALSPEKITSYHIQTFKQEGELMIK